MSGMDQGFYFVYLYSTFHCCKDQSNHYANIKIRLQIYREASHDEILGQLVSTIVVISVIVFVIMK